MSNLTHYRKQGSSAGTSPISRWVVSLYIMSAASIGVQASADPLTGDIVGAAIGPVALSELRGARNMASVRAHLTAVGVPLDETQVDIRPQRGLRYLAGRDIAPGCAAPDGEVTKKNAPELVRCVFDVHTPLLEERLGVDWAITSLTPPDKLGLQFARVRQRHGELDIKGSEVVVTFRKGRVTGVMGRLLTSDQAGELRAGGLKAADVRLLAQNATNEELDLARRYFDPACNCVVSEFRSRTSPMAHAIDETNGRHLQSWSAGDNATLVGRAATALRYPDGFSSDGEQTVGVAVIWNEGADGMAQACLDWGADAENGEPKVSVETADAFCLSVPSGAFSIPNNDATESMAMNAYFWMHDLGTFAKSPLSAYNSVYDWDSFDSEKLRVHLTEKNTCSSMNSPGAACAAWGPNEHSIFLPMETEAPFSLYLMAHEYGHFLHHMYGWRGNGLGDFMSNAIKEGFADHNVLRYAMYRQRTAASGTHDLGFTALYEDDFWGQSYDHRVDEVFVKGEATPFPRDRDDSHPALTWNPSNPASPCVRQDARDRYRCGSLMGTIFWTLAHNTLRVGYGGIPAGTPLLDTSTFPPEFLAGAAFTHALVSLPATGNVNDFFHRVSEYYYVLQQEGSVSSAERHRINQVLAMHCVGWSGHTCRQWHRTVNQDRPAAWTAKASFEQGHNEHFLRAEEMVRSGTPANIPFDTPDGLGFMRLDSSDDRICASVLFPDAGGYSVQASIRSENPGVDAAWLWVGEGPWEPWTFTGGQEGWHWESYLPRIFITQAGKHNVCLAFREPIAIDVDAILVERR